MAPRPTRINEGSEFSIPLKNLVGLIGFTALAVWAYFGIIERLSFLEHEQEMMIVEIEENDDWIDNFEPPTQVQDNIARVREIELRLLKLETLMSIKGDK